MSSSSKPKKNPPIVTNMTRLATVTKAAGTPEIYINMCVNNDTTHAEYDILFSFV